MPNEKTFWDLIRKNIKSPPDTHLVRIENAVYSGTPDVSYCIDGKEGFLELKYIEEYPKRESTVVAVDVRQAQRTWLHDRNIAGGRCYLAMSVKNKDIYIFDGLQAAMFLGKSWKKEDLKKHSLLFWVDREVKWDLFKERLKK